MRHERDAAARDVAIEIVERHVMRRWVHPGIVVLGAWLIVGPATMGVRSHAILWSDVVAGALLVCLGFMFAPRHAWVPWVTALIGVWLLLAPVVLGTSSPTAYLNDTVIGAFVIVLAIVIPKSIRMVGRETPAGSIGRRDDGGEQRSTYRRVGGNDSIIAIVHREDGS